MVYTELILQSQYSLAKRLYKKMTSRLALAVICQVTIVNCLLLFLYLLFMRSRMVSSESIVRVLHYIIYEIEIRPSQCALYTPGHYYIRILPAAM